MLSPMCLPTASCLLSSACWFYWFTQPCSHAAVQHYLPVASTMTVECIHHSVPGRQLLAALMVLFACLLMAVQLTSTKRLSSYHIRKPCRGRLSDIGYPGDRGRPSSVPKSCHVHVVPCTCTHACCWRCWDVTRRSRDGLSKGRASSVH